jgi:hypothetical protein
MVLFYTKGFVFHQGVDLVLFYTTVLSILFYTNPIFPPCFTLCHVLHYGVKPKKYPKSSKMMKKAIKYIAYLP